MHANRTGTAALRRGSRAATGAVVAIVLAACSPAVERSRGTAAIAAVAPEATVPSSTTTTAPPVVAPGAALTSTGVVVPVLEPAGDGWLVGTPCSRTATVTNLRALPGTVVLDAGHGGSETGAIGAFGSRESDLNLAVVSYAQQALEAMGVSAIPTRTRDYRVAITARAAIVDAVKPRAALSIHHNSSFSHLRETPGTEIFHQAVGDSSVESRRLAGLVYEEVTALLARLEVEGWAATPRPGAKPRRNSEGNDFYGVLRRTQGTPTALVEIGFISNAAEARHYAEPDVQKALGEALARGVVRFMTTNDPGSGYVNPPQLADDDRLGGGTANCKDPPLG
ncbi:MAG: N-acetylmuramoyl-L-alanine amidase family protein [Acidimicrobiia bacterium]